MPIKAIRAVIECEGCGVEFSVGIAEDLMPEAEWCMWDVAQDAVRGSLDYRQASGQPNVSSLAVSSIQDGKMLCADCTRTADAKEASP